MTNKDAFALAFDNSDSTENGGDGVVHISCRFKVEQYGRGEQGGEDGEGTGEDSMPSLRDMLSEAISSHGSVAMDRAPAKTPFSDCKAKNPYRCRYHGQAALKELLNKLIERYDITPKSPVSISKEVIPRTFRLDVDVSPTDVGTMRHVIREFGMIDGIQFDETDISIHDGKTWVRYDVDELDPDDEFEDELYDDELPKGTEEESPTPPGGGSSAPTERAAGAPDDEPAGDPPSDGFAEPTTVAEGVMKIDELKNSSGYLESLLAMPHAMSESLANDLRGVLEKEKAILERYTKATEELRRKDETESGKEVASVGVKPIPAKPRAKKVATDTKVVFGKSTTVLDGYTGKDINKAREAAGLAPLEALKHIDNKVKAKTENFRLATKKLAEEYGDPELDISDPKVFEAVQRNWAETVKAIANEGQFCSFCEPYDVLGFLSDGHYRTHLRAGRLANLAHCYGTARDHADEAAISSVIRPSDPVRKFETRCCDRFGPLCIEWRKDGNLVPCFSNCDADEPANQDRHRVGGQVYNTSLISNPSICSLAAFCQGLDAITEAIGHVSPIGKPESSWMNAIKILRKGPIRGDAKDFEMAVNGEDKWRHGLVLYGWNEAPLLGHGTVKDVAGIHFNTKKWESMRSSAFSHGTEDYASAKDFVEALKKSRGPVLKENGIKVFLDGNEMPLD